MERGKACWGTKYMHAIGDVQDFRTISYICTIVRNAAIDSYRKKKRGTASLEELLTEPESNFDLEHVVCDSQEAERVLAVIAEQYHAVEEEEYLRHEEKEETFYTEGFEDKIYDWIRKLPIRDPRRKAKRIWLTCVGILVVAIMASFAVYHHAQKPVRATAQIEKLFVEAGKKMLSLPSGLELYVQQEGGSSALYQIQILNTEQESKLKRSDISYQRCKGGQFTETHPSGGGVVCCYVAEPYRQSWKAYSLCDRDTKQYYILQNEMGDMAIAKYCGINLYSGAEKRDSVKGVLKNIFGITTAEDVRSISLERCKAKSEAEPDKLIEAYVGTEEKQNILSYFGEDSLILSLQECHEDAIPELDDAYYLGIENQYHEVYVMTIVKKGEKVQVFADKKRMDANGFRVELSEEMQKQIAAWIDWAEEK